MTSIIPKYCFLKNEQNISPEDEKVRFDILNFFRTLPVEAFSKLRHFQPQIGCFNKCSFCSQAASSRIIEFDKTNITNIVAAMKAVAIENGIKTGYLPEGIINGNGELSQDFIMPKHGLISYELASQGIIYCYLDNDPSLYNHLSYLVQILYENLGVRTRIATVGYSRKNALINENFTTLSSTYLDYLAGVRLSISPYTYGWSDRIGYSKKEFEFDLANFISTFKPLLNQNKKGKRGFCVELRFRPLVLPDYVKNYYVNQYLVIETSQEIYISINKVDFLNVSNLIDSSDHSLSLTYEGIDMLKVTKEYLHDFSENQKHNYNKSTYYRMHKLHKLENQDGYYFGIDVERLPSGQSYAKYYYPANNLRKNSGTIDGERYFLNALIDLRIGKSVFSWEDVDGVVKALEDKAFFSDEQTKIYIEKDILPLINTYISALKLSNLPPKYFFDKNFTIDTGHICNLGRAYQEYKLLASRKDLPMTPNHERTFGLNSDLANEGVVYRLAPSNERRKSNTLSKQKLNLNKFIIEKLNLASTSTFEGQSEVIYEFELDRLHISKMEKNDSPIIPGQI